MLTQVTRTFLLDRLNLLHAPLGQPLVGVVEAGTDEAPQAADEEEEEELPHGVVDAYIYMSNIGCGRWLKRGF